jgi:hypothetical protein
MVKSSIAFPPKNISGKIWRFNDCDEAGIAQLVERKFPKLEVAGPSPVARSKSF